MDDDRFDGWTRRRFGLATAGLSIALITPPTRDATARKNRKKPLRLNAFGCVEIGGKCRGRNTNCCSGVCDGKKPKKGWSDRSRCVAHDAGSGCQAGQVEQGCGGTTIECTTSTGFLGHCNTTTGNAGVCIHAFACLTCRKDADCRERCGPAASCIPCADCDDTACVGPSPDDCDA